MRPTKTTSEQNDHVNKIHKSQKHGTVNQPFRYPQSICYVPLWWMPPVPWQWRNCYTQRQRKAKSGKYPTLIWMKSKWIGCGHILTRFENTNFYKIPSFPVTNWVVKTIDKGSQCYCIRKWIGNFCIGTFLPCYRLINAWHKHQLNTSAVLIYVFDGDFH